MLRKVQLEKEVLLFFIIISSSVTIHYDISSLSPTISPISVRSSFSPIGAKFGTRHEPDARQVLRDFGGATPRDGAIIAQNVLIRGGTYGLLSMIGRGLL